MSTPKTPRRTQHEKMLDGIKELLEQQTSELMATISGLTEQLQQLTGRLETLEQEHQALSQRMETLEAPPAPEQPGPSVLTRLPKLDTSTLKARYHVAKTSAVALLERLRARAACIINTPWAGAAICAASIGLLQGSSLYLLLSVLLFGTATVQEQRHHAPLPAAA